MGVLNFSFGKKSNRRLKRKLAINVLQIVASINMMLCPTKNDWRLWKQLKTLETGLGWNPVTGKIEASDEWWLKKIEVSSPTTLF